MEHSAAKTVKNHSGRQKAKKKRQININGFAMLFIVLCAVAILTHIIPAGQFSREMVDGRELVVAGSYEATEQTPVGFLDLFTSIHEGMVQAGTIIFYVFIIGGMFNVINATGAIDTLLRWSAVKLADKRFFFVAGLMLVFSIGGSALGMGEESLIYIPLVVPIAIALGYDVLTGTAMVLVGMSVGFTSAALNPFTIGVAQSIAGLPMFSGIGPRLLMHVIMLTIAVLYIYRYAEKVRKDPFRGFFGEKSQEVELPKDGSQIIFEKKQKLVLAAFVANIAVIVFGAIRFEWYLGEMSACFVILSIVVAVIAKMGVEGYVNHFLQGAASLISGALIIGLAKAITVVLSEGNILDTILNGAASLLQNFPIAFVIIGMFFVQELIHFLVPSSSGQAMLTIPIMMPIADLLGITRQTTCFVFTLADGVGSIFWPTSGYFMAALGVYHVPYQVWLKKMFPLILIEYCVGMIASIIAANLHYGPF